MKKGYLKLQELHKCNGMEELIKINQDARGNSVVSARELYFFLNIETPFNKWMPRMLEYGFIENVDWTKMSTENESFNFDYALKLDCAKEIAMIQRSPEGKQARAYFIECEKKYREVRAIDTPETIMARALLMAKDTMDRQHKQLELANRQLELQSETVQYATRVLKSTTGHTSTTIASELNMSARTLNELLVKARFLRKTGRKGEYSVYANYQGKGMIVTETKDFPKPDGTYGTRIQIQFTELGRKRIHEIFHRAMSAGVISVRKGRWFINREWEPANTTEDVRS